MSEILVHNTGGDALVYTADGRLIGAHRTAAADTQDPVTTRLLGRGRLVSTSDRDTNSRPADHTTHTETEADEAPADGEEVLEEPAGNASRADWVDYAVSQGYDRDELDGLKRDEIRDLTTETTPAGGEQSAEQATAHGGAEPESEEEN